MNVEFNLISSRDIFVDKDYIIKEKIRFNNKNNGYNYIYNTKDKYDIVFIVIHSLLDVATRNEITKKLKQNNVEKVVFCSL